MVGSMLHRKLRRDLWVARWQFIGVILISALGIFVFSGLDAAWRDMDLTVQRYANDSHVAELSLAQEQFSPEEVNAIGSIDGIDRITARTTAEARVDLPHAPTLRIHLAPEPPAVNVPIVTDEDDSIPADNALYLEQTFADANGFEVGDELTVRVEQFEYTLKIRGLLRSAEYLLTTTTMVSDPEVYGFAWVYPTSGVLRQLPPNEITLTLDNNADIDAVRERLQSQYPGAFVYGQDLNQGIANFQSDVNAFRNLSAMLPVLFVFVAALVIMATMKRLVDTQRNNIGILHSLGYPRKRIAAHYLAFSLVPTAIGAIVGLLLGRWLLPSMLWYIERQVFALPERVSAPLTWQALAVTIGIIALSTAVGFLAIREHIRHQPAELLRASAPQSGSTMLLERTPGIWNHLSFNGKLVLRNLSRQRLRTLMAFFGVMICTALIVTSFGMRTSMITMIDNYYADVLNYDVYVTLRPGTTISDEDLQGINASRIDVGQSSVIEVSSESSMLTTSLLVMEPGQQSIGIGEMPTDGIVVPELMASELNITPGDTVRVHIAGFGDPVDMRVSQLLDITVASGMYTSVAYWIELTGEPFVPTNVMLTGDDGAIASSLADQPYVDRVESIASLKASMLDLVNTMLSVIWIMIAVALMLAFVVLNTMGTLNLLERAREFATLKVLGYHQQEIRGLIVRENLIVTVAAALLGIPVGYVLTGWVMASAIPENLIIPTVLSWWAILLPVVITVVFSWLVQLWIARSVRDIDMVTALKSVE